MIKCLQIRNYAIIESLEINFSKGLTIITGETGAGKSILLGALGLIMGKRADTKSLYDTEKKCVVEAFFDVSKYELKEFFDTNDIDYEEECVVRRELTPSGKSRAFVNDTPVNLNQLRQLSHALVDLHQQFDMLDIHNVSFQLRMVDALAGNKDLLARYQTHYRKYLNDKKRLNQLIDQNDNANKEVDFIQFQLKEFNEIELIENEQEELESERARLTNAEEIKQTLSAAYQHLIEGDAPLIGQLETVEVSIGELKQFHSDLPGLHQRLEGLVLELQDLVTEFEKIAEGTEYNPERIIELQERLDAIYRLQQKHRVTTVKELIDIQNDLQQQLDAFGDLSSEIEALKAEIDQQEKALRELAQTLSEKRKSVIPNFEKRIHSMLVEMTMKHARFQVEVNELEELTATGNDEVHFLFAANLGSRLQHIKDVASGGEISRLTLVTKSLVASAIPLPTLIFDEIDTGISGDISLKMGNILRKLSNHHQVVSITHSPQIASKADAHYFVYKKIKEDKTLTMVKALNEDERVRAIATMLSQNPPSESALQNARELLALSS